MARRRPARAGSCRALLRSRGGARGVTALPAALLAWDPAAGEWCAKEVLGHLIGRAAGFASRVRQILESREGG
jgi:hypothetical protein